MGLFSRSKKPAAQKGSAPKPAAQAPTQDAHANPVAQMGYEDGQRALSPRWQPATQYSDRHVDTLRSKDKAAGGNINQVDLLSYRDLQLGSGQQGFFKEALTTGEVGDASRAIGIDEKDPRLENRSVATSRVAETMGVGGVIAKTAFASHDGRKGAVSEKAAGRALVDTSDLEMTDPVFLEEVRKSPEEYIGDARGMDPFGAAARYKKDPETGKVFRKNAVLEVRGTDLSNPRTQKELNDLQWIDTITGQVDRHGGNIFVDPQSGAVKGIDNDASFGSVDSDDPRKFANATMGASHYAGLPTLIDAATANHIKSLGEDDLRKRIAPLLSQKEVEDTIARLKAAKARIQFLELAGSVVGGGEGQQHAAWDASTFEEEKDSETSYLGRSVRNYDEATASAAQRPSGELKVETREQAAAWRPKPAGVQVPKHLEKAVAAMPSLTADTFDRHRGGPKKAPGPAPAVGAHRMPRAIPVPSGASEQASTLSSPPKRPLPEPPKRRPLPIPPQKPPAAAMASKKAVETPKVSLSTPPKRPPPSPPGTKKN